MRETAQTKDDLADLMNVAIEELVRNCFELPGFTTLLKEARRGRTEVNRGLYRRIAHALGDEGRAHLDRILTVEPGWHPCSVHLHAACEASANSIEASALGLAVAVEGITNALFPDCARHGPDYRILINDLYNYISIWKRDSTEAEIVRVRERIQGFRGQLLQVRAVDRLYQLARDGMLDERHIAAWKALRNTSAHAGAPGAPVNQELIDNVLSVTMLMYHLVFYATGYNGRYIDYSTHGFPPRSYPSRELAPDP